MQVEIELETLQECFADLPDPPVVGRTAHRLQDILFRDEDGVYDPSNFNDRLVLGLKGTMSEAELHVLKARLRGGVLNKVRRGEYRCPLPAGFVYDGSGNVVLDPDSQVRESIAYFFETFSRVGSACQTVKVFKREGLRFPSRLRNGETTIFRPLTASAAMRTLHNPRYSGAYAYGRRRFRRNAEGKTVQQNRACDDWLACIPDAHPGYITWDRYQENLKLLESNGRGYQLARSSPPREGAALLQGRAVCGRCGRHMRVRYATRRGRQEAWYVCDRAHGADDGLPITLGRPEHGEPGAQAYARLYHRGCHADQVAGGRNNQGSRSLQRWQDGDHHDAQSKIFGPTGHDTTKNCVTRRQTT